MKEIKTINNKTSVLLQHIDSREIAYLIGFICADSSIDENHSVEISTKKDDIEIPLFLSQILNCNINIDNTFIKEKRRFPRVRFNRRIKDILSFIKGRKKNDRILPIVSRSLNRALIKGFFDGDGCITWGKRKDRGRIWQKVSFTSSIKMLSHVQNILYKELEISTIIRPKKDENTFVLEFSNKVQVLKFLNWLYEDDFIVLKRKYNTYNALRLELDKFGGTTNNSTIPSRVTHHCVEGVETSGEKMDSLNNHN